MVTSKNIKGGAHSGKFNYETFAWPPTGGVLKAEREKKVEKKRKKQQGGGIGKKIGCPSGRENEISTLNWGSVRHKVFPGTLGEKTQLFD